MDENGSQPAPKRGDSLLYKDSFVTVRVTPRGYTLAVNRSGGADIVSSLVMMARTLAQREVKLSEVPYVTGLAMDAEMARSLNTPGVVKRT